MTRLQRVFVGKAGRRWAVGAAVLGTIGVLWLTLGEPLGTWAFQRRVAADYHAAKQSAIGSVKLDETTLLQRHLPLFGSANAELRVREAEEMIIGLRVAEIKFTTVSLTDGQRRTVDTLLLVPESPGDDLVTLYLPSSAAKRGALLDAEAVLFANRLSPLRRVLVVPLPTYEQRGGMWPRLESLDADGLITLLRQTALDTRRAVDACREQGLQVGGLAGYSLGACLAASVSGLHPEAFQGAALTLFAGGGDLTLLVQTSDHPLAKKLARPEGMSGRRWEALLHTLDPLTWAPRAKVGSVRMVAGWRDEVVPIECTQALMAGYEQTSIPCRLEMEEGGHPLAEGALQMLGRLKDRVEDQLNR